MGPLWFDVRGRGWSLSVQRWRAEPAPPLSSNLGAAALVSIDRKGRARHLAVRLALEERFWIAVTTQLRVVVSGVLADGRALVNEQFFHQNEGPVLHRLWRIVGEDEEAIGWSDITVINKPDASSHSMTVTVGDRVRVNLCVIAALEFDTQFGRPLGGDDEPRVYGGWRLP